jgi:hypothetical protein
LVLGHAHIKFTEDYFVGLSLHGKTLLHGLKLSLLSSKLHLQIFLLPTQSLKLGLTLLLLLFSLFHDIAHLLNLYFQSGNFLIFGDFLLPEIGYEFVVFFVDQFVTDQ